MQGILKQDGMDEYGNPQYFVEMNGQVYPAGLRDVGVRNLEIGGSVTFMTDRETGSAILGEPSPVRGIEAPRP